MPGKHAGTISHGPRGIFSVGDALAMGTEGPKLLWFSGCGEAVEYETSGLERCASESEAAGVAAVVCGMKRSRPASREAETF